MVLLPNGNPLAIQGNEMIELAAANGEVLRRQPACSGPHGSAAGMLDDRRFVMVCDGRILQYDIPSLTSQQVATLTGFTVSGAAFHPSWVVVADIQHVLSQATRIVGFDPSSWAQRFSFDLKVDDAEGVAVSADGRMLAVGGGGLLQVRELPSLRIVLDKRTQRGRVTATSFSPDGRRLFVHDETFEAAIWDVAAKARAPVFKVGSWVTSSLWIDDHTVIATGSDGVVQLSDRGDKVLIDGMEGVGLALSRRERLACYGSSGGQVRCRQLRP